MPDIEIENLQRKADRYDAEQSRKANEERQSADARRYYLVLAVPVALYLLLQFLARH